MSTAIATAYRRVAHRMGMPISLALRGRSAGSVEAEAAWQEALRELDRVDAMFSTYRTDSVVSRLDRAELTLSEVSSEVAEVLEIGERARVESDGAFAVWRPDATGRLRLEPLWGRQGLGGATRGGAAAGPSGDRRLPLRRW
jgi:FAD:protein FMN transferase